MRLDDRLDDKKIINKEGDYLVDDEIYDKNGRYKCKASLSLFKLMHGDKER